MNIFYVKPKKAPSKGILNTTEKCPHCLIGFVDFMDIGLTLGLQKGVLLGCYACGGVFVSLDACASEKAGKREMVGLQKMKAASELIPGIISKELEQVAVEAFNDKPEPGTEVYAKCGKLIPEGKSLQAHERSCKKCKEIAVRGMLRH